MRRLLVLAGLLFLLVGTAHADENDPANRYNSTVHARVVRDTPAAVVLTARDLAEHGVNNLADALDLITQVSTRQGGKGDIRLDVRGAKQRSIMILIDGVPVDEPYYGAFDLSTIPVTDIVKIRVTLTPASPLEGPGGDGGTVEVTTLDASGGRRLAARLEQSDQPLLWGAATARSPIAGGLAVRLSGGGFVGAENFQALDPSGTATQIDQLQKSGHGALRLEYVLPRLRVTGEVFAVHRNLLVPPAVDEVGTSVEDIKSDTSVRAVLGLETHLAGWRLALGGYDQYIARLTDTFTSASLSTLLLEEDLHANVTGAAMTAERNLGPWHLAARLSLDSQSATDTLVGGMTGGGRETLIEAAVGAELHWRQFAVEAAVGLAAPIASSRSPWPEARVAVTYTPNPIVQLRVVGARKGRLPTLRELYGPMTGNPNLRPEIDNFVELDASLHPWPLLTLKVAGYYKYLQDLIRLSVPGSGMAGSMTTAPTINIDTIQIRGLEPSLEIAPLHVVGGGVAYVYQDAYSPTLDAQTIASGMSAEAGQGMNPIENFPRHRFDVWVTTHYRIFGTWARLRYVATRDDMSSPLPDYFVVDTSAWVRLRRELRATVRVDNVLDQPYAIRFGVPSLGRVISVALDGVWE